MDNSFEGGDHLAKANSEKDQKLVAKTVESAIANFSDLKESYDIKNITEDYTPLVVDKILQKSDKVLVIDTNDELVGKYTDKLNRFLDDKKSVTVYSAMPESPFTSKLPAVEFHHLTNNEIKELSNKNIRNIIIGDDVRFMWKMTSPKPTYSMFTNAIKQLFGSDRTHNTESVAYQSLTNFFDRSQVNTLLKTVAQIVEHMHM